MGKVKIGTKPCLSLEQRKMHFWDTMDFNNGILLLLLYLKWLWVNMFLWTDVQNIKTKDVLVNKLMLSLFNKVMLSLLFVATFGYETYLHWKRKEGMKKGGICAEDFQPHYTWQLCNSCLLTEKDDHTAIYNSDVFLRSQNRKKFWWGQDLAYWENVLFLK